MGLPSQLLPFSQINSGSGPNRGRKGNSDREAGRERPAHVPNAARASKTSPPNRAPRNTLMAGGFDMAVTSGHAAGKGKRRILRKACWVFFFPHNFLAGGKPGREPCVLNCFGKEFRQIKQTTESLESITSH